ncbi:hypothetical protein RO3G_12904 [Lichtheimia corymbifera JMRC:FSU:9682]|uniref:UBA domain-containing protein n=1 Tax=Lichtheimia corymbifera JMRC:FSU:9682 TaxID=1263082 RepID=A0A068RJD5_9FUNG|nr:hypothetical protein RO3G_12904 [Lichtheimia corymbifera JMRC:FSU:9682]
MTATAAATPDRTTSKKPTARSDFISRYQDHTLQYHNQPEQDIFPRAYHTLVHCPIEALYNTLLGLEQDYAMVIQERYMACRKEQAEIEERHNREIEASGSSQMNMTHLFARHVEDMEVFQATWASDILQTQQTQRQEYRSFVIELYQEYQQRLAALSDEKDLKPEDVLLEAEKNLDGKDIVSVAAERVRQTSVRKSVDSPLNDRSPQDHRRPRQDSSASAMSHVSSTSTSGNGDHQQSPNSDGKDKFQKMVRDIEEMGFTKDQAETALGLTNHIMEHAVTLLLEDPAKVNTAMQQQQQQAKRRSSSLSQHGNGATTSPAHSRTSSLNDIAVTGSRRQSLQRGMSPNSRNSNATNKGWSPISFLQQQKQVMENTNLSSVRKLGGWLGKAMENFMDNDESDPRFGSSHTGTIANAQQPVESFTISLGPAQIKSTHNLRLLVADAGSDIFNPMPYDPTREMAYKAQTSTNLYTNHLSAMVVLVELSELNRNRDQQGTSLGWRQYRTGKGSNKALFERCQHSTEFHFPDIETQLTVIEQDYNSRPDSLQEGSFFITRHSNLPSTQVIFHLVVDSESIPTTEISKQSPLIKGLLKIMRITTRYDISSLSIPLLLLPDKFLEQPEQYFSTAFLDQPQHHFAWLQKRGEVAMKCVRGFLYEHSGNSSNKRVQEGVDRAETVFGGGLHNVEFLLPDSHAVYGGQRSDPNSTGHHHHHSTTTPNTTPGGNSSTAAAASSTINSSHGGSSSFDVEFAFQKFRILLVSIFQTC